MKMPSQVAAEFVRAAEAVAEELVANERREQQELALPLEEMVAQASESLRGKYDVSRLRRDHPQLVNLITWLLSLPGMTHQAIAEACGKGVCWETVAAIAAMGAESIREFKLRQAAKLQLVLDAATPGLMAKAAQGKLSALDFKLLTDAFLQLSGEGHTVRFEGRQEDDPRRARLREVLASGRGSGMVFEAEILPQKAESAGLPLPPPVVPAGPIIAGDSQSPENRHNTGEKSTATRIAT